MKIVILAIGKVKAKPVQALVHDYGTRLAHYLPFEVVPARDDAQALAKLEAQDCLVVLDEHGAQKSSTELAALLAEHQRRATKRIVFHIGGPDGVGAAMKKRANLVLGLSRMTLPHELVQALLAEQLYRACSINRGEPYHRA